MTDSEDHELLEKFRNDGDDGKHYAFNLLVKKYQQRLYYHIRRMVIDHEDASDLMQNTFIKVWKNLDGFREDSRFYTWIYRIATNECLVFLKKKRQRFFLPVNDVEAELSRKLGDSSYINSGKLELKLQQAILKLPEKQRLVFNMRYYDEIPYEEMAEITGTSIGALKASYHHAVQKVKDYLTSV